MATQIPDPVFLTHALCIFFSSFTSGVVSFRRCAFSYQSLHGHAGYKVWAFGMGDGELRGCLRSSRNDGSLGI